MTPNEFFEVLGYLTHPKRECKLDAEMHSGAQNGFERRYLLLSGITPRVNNHNYYILHQGADKWGVELRVYFYNTSGTVPQAIQTMIRSSRPGDLRDTRINNNDLIWDFIEYGFLLDDTQNEPRVRQRVPAQYLSDFNRGYNIS